MGRPPKPPAEKRRAQKYYVAEGEAALLDEWARILGVPLSRAVALAAVREARRVLGAVVERSAVASPVLPPRPKTFEGLQKSDGLSFEQAAERFRGPSKVPQMSEPGATFLPRTTTKKAPMGEPVKASGEPAATGILEKTAKRKVRVRNG